MIGQTVSHYQITEKLGQGGMGVVYKAQDTRLDRPVALKFLPTHSLPTDDDKARFYREAKAAASLSHANICTIHEIDEAGGRTFIAMEFIDGETLAEKIKQGPLKLNEAVDVALQVAAGLQAAHERNIVHRDIKASNVMFTEKGQVKIMDFGLAKTAAASVLTKEGTTVGTAAYMSPEQARGHAVDHRTDLWSLGVVMYEMISGHLPFSGDYEQSIIYSIMNEDPEALTGLRTGVPLALERVVAKLLMKDASLRYQSAVEIPSDLKAIDLTTTSTTKLMTTATRPVAQAEAPPRPAIPWRVAALAAVALALVAGGLGWLLKPAPAPEPQPVARFSVTLPSTERFTRTGRHYIAFSPDGTRLVHSNALRRGSCNRGWRRMNADG